MNSALENALARERVGLERYIKLEKKLDVLRSECDRLREELARVRGLLERWHDWWTGCGHDPEMSGPTVYSDTRAFLAGQGEPECNCEMWEQACPCSSPSREKP